MNGLAHDAAAPSARHLLVVDDDDRIRELLKQYLARAGFRVIAAADAAAARAAAGACSTSTCWSWT